VTDNTLTNITGDVAIQAGTANSKVSGNKVSETGGAGIVVTESETTVVEGNQLKDCALTNSGFADSVILVNPNSKNQADSQTKLIENVYTGNQKNLGFFIYVNYGHAILQDNRTNTTLKSSP
jgi:parallel beta-helix repeat protein